MSPEYLSVLVPIVLSLKGVWCHFDDICGPNNGRRYYLEHGESGTSVADFRRNAYKGNSKNNTGYSKCTVEFITCPSCVVEVEFRFLNISRNCGKASVFDTCGCDYVWIYEPPAEDASGEQFCGNFVKNNISELSYVSQTRTVAISFIYNNEYGHAFTLDYSAKRNRINISGHPRSRNMNNASQYISSPFFPYSYPMDLSVEYVITCESSEPCRISLLFTDFLIDESSIIEFFDWNGQRMYVISGNIFRPPMIMSNGPSLVIRFYANGASNLGFKAAYSFILGNLDEYAFKPNTACGGHVNNLGGGITMMNMVDEGTKLFDCVWIIKPPQNFLHRKTHLYVKIATFQDFAGTTDLTIRQGVTSTQPSVEVLRHPTAHYNTPKQEEHVVPISQGFYIRLKGIFKPESRLEVVYAAFNYKDCFGGSDFLCHNLRCISVLLNCDGFDHCGDNSDEPANCSQYEKDHRFFSKVPNFFFPKIEPYSDITAATFVFLTCSFGIILAMALLLYRINTRARHQRQIQDHIETIHAILEEGVRGVEEEIITPDDPPDYEPPPEYNELLKMKYFKEFEEMKFTKKRCSHCNLLKLKESSMREIRSTTNLSTSTEDRTFASTSRSCQTTPDRKLVIPDSIPDSPPPSYQNIDFRCQDVVGENATPGPSSVSSPPLETTELRPSKYLFETAPSHLLSQLRRGFSTCNSSNLFRRRATCSEENLIRSFSDSELIYGSTCDVDCWGRARKVRFGKSFSTDDLSRL